MTELRGARILVTGPAGQVAFPVARALARTNDVVGVARFSRAGDRERLEAAGVRCIAADLGADAFDGVPGDVDVVLHFAVAKSRDGDFDRDLTVNAEGTGRLMSHCRRARAVLVCSSTGVYQDAGHVPLTETHPLGDNHRTIMPTYSICKIATEATARFCAREWGIPTTIARLNVPYGDNGGWPAVHLDMILAGRPIPVHPQAPNVYNPIHEDDILATLPALLDAAGVPATIVNWAGHDQVSIEDWSAHLGALVGRPPTFLSTDRTIASVVTDTTKMERIAGRTRVHWRDGMRRMVAARHPEMPLRGQ
jgi:nucleoside-diphosphate-sugar epimerase